MCCWPFADVELEDAPPPKKKEEKKEYRLVSDQLQLHPLTSFFSSAQVTKPRMSFHYTYVPHAPAPHPWDPKPKKVEVAKAPVQYVYGYPTPPAMIYQPPTATIYYAPQPAPEPVKTNYWYGASKAEVDKRNIEAAHATGATKPVQLAPHGTSADQQFYVKELDGSWTLRTTTDIMGSCLPGHWEYAQGGYPFFVRKKKD